MLYSSSSGWRDALRSWEQGRSESDAHWQEICQESKLEGTSITKKAYTEAMWKSFGNRCLGHDLTLEQGDDEVRDGS